MFHKRIATLLMAAAVGAFTAGLAGGTVKADDQTINVDTTQAIRPVDHVASGGLYALADANTPNADLLSPLKPKVFTQAPPYGQQIPNGEPKTAGEFPEIQPTAHKLGAKVIVRLPDFYPKFPYNYSNEQDWLNHVKTMVTAAQQNSDDVYAYELWNEPNANWNNSWGNFDQVWKDTYHVVKAIAPNAKILGPSLNGWNGGGWMKSFLTYCRDNNVLPDYICWHEWNAANFPKEAQALDAMEDSLGITRRPISINEYGWKNELAVPGQMIHYVQNFENVNELDSACLAFWYNYGRMDNLLTNDQKPNGGYWLYKWYGDMSGQMDQTSTFNTNGALASIANTTSDKGQTSVILGGTSGDTTVNVNNLDTSKYGKFAKVEVNATPWYGVDTAVDSPKTVASGTVAVNNGSVSIPVKDMKASSGYQVVVTPTTDSSATGVQYVQPSAGDPIRVEAEDSALFGAKTTIQTKSSYPSGNKYVSGIDDTQSGVTFKPNALAAGTYKVEVGYANGYQDSAVDSVTLNNKPLQDLTMPYTTGWLDDSLNVHGTRRVVQYGNVDLNKGENTFTLQKKSGFAELDYVQFTPVTPNPTPTPTPVNPDNSNTDQTSSSTNTSSSSSAASSSSTATEPAKTDNHNSSSQTTTNRFKVYAKKSLYRYKSVNFTKNNRVKKYVVKNRTTAPTFTVVAKAKSANGAARYKLSDGTYITANKKYVANLYWQTKHSKVYAAKKTGLNEYKNTTLSKRNQVRHVKKGQVLHVKKIVKHGSTTRFQLTNGNYISGNKQMTSLIEP